MRNIKTRYIWISIAISFLIAVGLIIGVTFTSGVWTTVCIVLIAIVFIYMTLAIQFASVRTFKYKPKPKHYPTITYTSSHADLDEALKKEGYKPRAAPYGMSYLKVTGTNAYKVVVIRSCEKYFNQEQETENSTPNKALKNCKKFIGCEIFLDYDEDTLRKLPDFNLAGNNIYYCGLYKEVDKFICPNYIEPSEKFQELYDQIKKDLAFEEELPESIES